MKWTHDKRAGLIKCEGVPGYICRGFREEHGNLIAAAPELLEVAEQLLDAMQRLTSGHPIPIEVYYSLRDYAQIAIEDAKKQ